MNSKQPTYDGVVEDFQQHRDLVAAKSEPVPQFQPTDLDRALDRDPIGEADRRALLVASQKEAPPLDNHLGTTTEQSPPASSVEPADRQGQQEAAAASLAGGMIAAEGRPVTAAEAVKKEREVLDELKRRE